MSEPLDRQRTLELLSEFREGELEPRLHSAVAARVAGDAELSQTLAALDELARLLASLQVRAEPGAELAERAARAALAKRRARPAPALAFRPAARYRPATPAPLQAAAAVAMLATGLVGLLGGPDPGRSHTAARLVERTSLELRQQSGRLVENIRQLGEAVGVAVESRIDRVGDRVEDYRRLLEQRRREDAPAESRAGEQAREARGFCEPRVAPPRTHPTSATAMPGAARRRA